jgi:gas vesicle protein
MDDIKAMVGFLTGLVVGCVTGLVLGILLAPQSGEETRELLREKGIELKGRAEDLSEEGRSRLQEAIEEGKTAAVKKKEELTQALEAEQEAKKSQKGKAKA